MAQTMSGTGGQSRQLVLAENLAVSLPAAGNTVLLEIALAGAEELGCSFDVTVQALDNFVIEGKVHPDSGYVVLYTNPTVAGGLIIALSGSIGAQAAGTTGWFILNVRSLWGVRISASSAVNNATVSAYAGATGQ